MTSSATQAERYRALYRMALVLFTWLFVMHAWMVDDAYFTLRQVDNFINGFGLRFNVVERVQSYTHPLWMMVLVPFHWLTREAFFTPIAVSLATGWLMFASASKHLDYTGEHWRKLLFIAPLFCSKAFMDYTSSGLENPLTNLLLVAFYGRFLRRRLHWSDATEGELATMFLLASLAFVNRSDTVAYYVPAGLWLIALHLRTMRLRLLRPIAIGASPAIVWTAFSLLYYGAPFPNTVYAKVTGARVPKLERLADGGLYLLDSLTVDPVTLPLCFVSMALVVTVAREPRGKLFDARVWAALGLLAYILYVLLFGASGTHMSGRFYSGCAVLAALIIAASARGSEGWAIAGFAALLGFFAPSSPFKAGQHHYQAVAGNGWGAFGLDTRVVVQGEGGALLSIRRGTRVMPSHHWYTEGLAMRAQPEHFHIGGAVPGYTTYAAGPAHHFVDPLALTEPLLARLPPSRANPGAPGHVPRAIPAGYDASIRQNRNVLEDPSLREFYDVIRLVTRAPLFAPGRLRAIWRLNTGYYDPLIRDYARRQNLRW